MSDRRDKTPCANNFCMPAVFLACALIALAAIIAREMEWLLFCADELPVMCAPIDKQGHVFRDGKWSYEYQPLD